MTTELVEMIKCRTEGGQHVTVLIYQDVREHRLTGGRKATSRGMKQARLETGELVQPHGQDAFEILKTGEIITRA